MYCGVRMFTPHINKCGWPGAWQGTMAMAQQPHSNLGETWDWRGVTSLLPTGIGSYPGLPASLCFSRDLEGT